MKWAMIIVFMWGRYPAIERVEGFTDRRDCILASQEMRASFKAQMGGPFYGDATILTYCVKVGRR